MGSCAKVIKAKNGHRTCSRPTRDGKRYCEGHLKGRRPRDGRGSRTGTRSRKGKQANDGCGGMLLVMLAAALLVLLGIVM